MSDLAGAVGLDLGGESDPWQEALVSISVEAGLAPFADVAELWIASESAAAKAAAHCHGERRSNKTNASTTKNPRLGSTRGWSAIVWNWVVAAKSSGSSTAPRPNVRAASPKRSQRVPSENARLRTSAAFRYGWGPGMTGASSAIKAGRIGIRWKLGGSSKAARLRAVRSNDG